MNGPGLPRLRTAIVATAAASFGYAVLWLVTTQLPEVRAQLPFGDDPYDLVASIAIVLLPLVGGLTAIRVLRYGLSRIPSGAVAARIELGLAVCLGLVSAALAADALALWRSPMGPPGIPIAVGLVGIVSMVAWVALARAIADATSAPSTGPVGLEPDALDDVVALLPMATERRDRIGRAAEPVRHHRIAVGMGAAAMAGIAAVIWHALREGPWASPVAALVYGGILVAILLVAYGLLLVPLRLLRPG